jgi:hypothetical protein
MEIKFSSKPYMPTVYISALMLVSCIFLPWVTAGVAGIIGSGTGDWGAMSTIAAILGIVFAYLTTAKIRSVGLMVIGVLSLVGAIIYATRLNGATLGFGLIINMLLSLAAIFIGFQDYSKSGK